MQHDHHVKSSVHWTHMRLNETAAKCGSHLPEGAWQQALWPPAPPTGRTGGDWSPPEGAPPLRRENTAGSVMSMLVVTVSTYRHHGRRCVYVRRPSGLCSGCSWSTMVQFYSGTVRSVPDQCLPKCHHKRRNTYSRTRAATFSWKVADDWKFSAMLSFFLCISAACQKAVSV